MVHRLLSLFRARLAVGAALLTASAGPAFKPAGSAAGDIITCGALTEVAAGEAGQAPSGRVLLFPMGDTALRGQGKTIRLVDQAHALAVITASRANAGAANIPVDYDHQLVFAAGKGVGGQAPAAGWIDPATLQADAAGIWADVQWTQAAAARLAAREYRYVSPSFFAAKDGRLLAIAHLSLVNYPAITDLPAVATAITNPEKPNMEKIATALGLPADASEEAILAAIAKMTAPPAGMATASASLSAEAIKTAAAALGLAATATVDEIITAAATAAKPDPAKFVPIAALNDVNARLAVLEDQRHEGILTAAAAAGKITPAMRDWAADYLKKDEAGFTAWLGLAQPIVTAGGQLKGPAGETDANGLTAFEIQTAAATGVSPEEFAAAKKKEAR
ncbi:MAG: hypothetical protein KGQ52_13870 [Alphaproteobacteria bacterium]|nr:hypothetical protein [Alphaproteobacteria bacterium]